MQFARAELPKVVTEFPDDPHGAFRELDKRWAAHLKVHGPRLGLKVEDKPKRTRRSGGNRSSSGGQE